MLNDLFIWLSFSVRSADAFGHHPLATSVMIDVPAVCALHSSGVPKKVSAKCATYNVVECLEGEFVPISLE